MGRLRGVPGSRDRCWGQWLCQDIRRYTRRERHDPRGHARLGRAIQGNACRATWSSRDCPPAGQASASRTGARCIGCRGPPVAAVCDHASRADLDQNAGNRRKTIMACRFAKNINAPEPPSPACRRLCSDILRRHVPYTRLPSAPRYEVLLFRERRDHDVRRVRLSGCRRLPISWEHRRWRAGRTGPMGCPVGCSARRRASARWPVHPFVHPEAPFRTDVRHSR